MGAVSRNDPCPCGSGQKYKRCCIDKKPVVATKKGWLYLLLYLTLAVGGSVAVGVSYGWTSGLGTATAALLFGGILSVVVRSPPASGKKSGSSDINFGR
ncbi:MAG: hypothetical protein CSB49_02555 [Proteobacteria bacterium]|nr:MAG: hypothetical protein CSB49_02555 [Pseudomonadota bacterium]